MRLNQLIKSIRPDRVDIEMEINRLNWLMDCKEEIRCYLRLLDMDFFFFFIDINTNNNLDIIPINLFFISSL